MEPAGAGTWPGRRHPRHPLPSPVMGGGGQCRSASLLPRSQLTPPPLPSFPFLAVCVLYRCPPRRGCGQSHLFPFAGTSSQDLVLSTPATVRVSALSSSAQGPLLLLGWFAQQGLEGCPDLWRVRC